MGKARLSGTLLLFLHLLQGSFGQQVNLCNKLTNKASVSSEQPLSRIQGFANSKNLNQNVKVGNLGLNGNIQQQNCKQTGLQLFLNCQKQQNLPLMQNVQQSSTNIEPLTINLQNQNFQSLPANLQQLILQQIYQQQIASTPINNIQTSGNQSPTADISLGSMPMVNGQISGLPSQVSKGVLLSNLGLTSSLPYLVANSCDPKQTTDQLTFVVPQSNALSVSHIPVSTVENEKNQGAISVSTSVSSDCSAVNNPSRYDSSVLVPVTLQSSLPQQSQPELIQKAYAPMQTAPTQFQTQSIHNIPTPVVSNQNQPSLTSMLLSQLETQNCNQQQFSPGITNYPSIAGGQTPKSSSIKALLPLLFNLLKEKNGCGCQPNYNCGCVNNQPNNNHGFNKNEPQIYSGYTSKKKYGQRTSDESNNTIGSEEDDKCDKNKRDKRKQNHKCKYNSEETYENDDEDEYEDDEV